MDEKIIQNVTGKLKVIFDIKNRGSLMATPPHFFDSTI
jgi:hypothetical protein